MKRRVTGTCIDYTHDGKGVLKIEGILFRRERYCW